MDSTLHARLMVLEGMAAVLYWRRHPSPRVAFEGTQALGRALAGRPVDALRVASRGVGRGLPR
jgi:hypothetical protein